MRRLSLLLLAPVLATLLAACATPDRSISTPMRAALGGIDAVLLIPQSGLDVTVQPTDGGQGGLLGVLLAAAIDAKREESAKKTAEPMLAALRGFDFRAEMVRALEDASAQQHRLQLRTPWRLETIDSESHRRGLYEASTASALLFVQASYRLESGNILVRADAQITPKSPALAVFRRAPSDGEPVADGNAIYGKSFSFKKQNVGAEAAAAALREGAASVVNQLMADLARDQ